MQFLREHDIATNLQLALKECLELSGNTWSISDNLSLFFLHYISSKTLLPLPFPLLPLPPLFSPPSLSPLPFSLPTCCGLSLPVTRRTKSSSERVREHPAFSPIGSPGWIDPGEFFKSAAVCVCGACVQNCVRRRVTHAQYLIKH